jgi:hypothetical protein
MRCTIRYICFPYRIHISYPVGRQGPRGFMTPVLTSMLLARAMSSSMLCNQSQSQRSASSFPTAARSWPAHPRSSYNCGVRQRSSAARSKTRDAYVSRGAGVELLCARPRPPYALVRLDEGGYVRLVAGRVRQQGHEHVGVFDGLRGALAVMRQAGVSLSRTNGL